MPDLPILFLARGGEIDGQQRQVSYLASGLGRNAYPVAVAVDAAGMLFDTLNEASIDTLITRMSPWRSAGNFLNRYIDARRLLQLAATKNIRVVHAHDVWRAPYARFIAKGLGLPYIVHVRGPLSARDIKKHRLADADCVIAIAQRYVSDLVDAQVAAARIVMIDDAVDLDLFNPQQGDRTYIRRTLGIKSPLVVGLVGRLSSFKRVVEYLEVIRLLEPKVFHQAEFIVVGDWERPDYQCNVDEALARLALPGRVRFVGRCASDLMPKLLSALDVLVTMSGGSSMFEAMAMGTTVLSIRPDSRHSEHTRHGETAWCVSGEDPAAAAAALAALMQNAELRRRLGGAAQAWVARHLSSAGMIARTAAIYQALAAERAGRGPVRFG